MGLVYSIILGSLVYIWKDYRDLFLFLQIITLPAIYYIGYEILMEKQKKNFKSGYNKVKKELQIINLKQELLKEKTKKIK